jgi:hypothetical protein
MYRLIPTSAWRGRASFAPQPTPWESKLRAAIVAIYFTISRRAEILRNFPDVKESGVGFARQDRKNARRIARASGAHVDRHGA